MRTKQRDAEFVEFVDARRAGLVRTAYLLCGDWHLAEDLVQQALIKLYAKWPRLVRQGAEDAYVRKILVNAHIDERRRLWRRSESPVSEIFGDEATGGHRVEERDELHQALFSLPAGQRRVVVARYWAGLSVEETAAELGCSAGTVKSQSSRALSRLRHVLNETTVEGSA